MTNMECLTPQTTVSIRGQISAVEAIGPAWRHMVKVLFRPFKIGKWLKLGLVAFLVALGSGGGGSFNIPTNAIRQDNFPAHKIQSIIEWVTSHLTLIIILVVVAVLVISIIWMIVIYFSSRFTFVYLDSVVRKQVEIKRAYKENRISGWSYFLWRIIFGPTALLVIMLLVGAAGLGIYFLVKVQGFTALAIILIILAVLIFIVLMIIAALIALLTNEFVVPIMYLRQLKVLKAWRVLLDLLKPNKTQFFVYLIFKILLGLAAGMLFIIPCCCLGMVFMPFYLLIAGLVLLALKYPLVWIGVVILGLVAWATTSLFWNTVISPITVFFRTYPLVFLEGFGKDFSSITPNT